MSLTTRPTMASWIDIGSPEPGEDGFALEDPVPRHQCHPDEQRDDEVADEHLVHGERRLAAEEAGDGDGDDRNDMKPPICCAALASLTRELTMMPRRTL